MIRVSPNNENTLTVVADKRQHSQYSLELGCEILSTQYGDTSVFMVIGQAFSALNLSDWELKTYLALFENGASTAGDLAKKLGTPRSSLYGFLQHLNEKGLVEQSQKHGIKTWQANKPEAVAQLLEKHSQTLTNVHEAFLKELPELSAKQSKDFVKPKFIYFEGKEGLQHALKELLLYRDIQTEAFWPIGEMLTLLGDDFFHDLNIKRIKRNIYTRAIWPVSREVDTVKYPALGTGEAFKREIRIAPKAVDATMGYWSFATKTTFISSSKESFGFTVESAELRQMIKAQFEVLWNASKPIKPTLTKETERFLKKI